MADNVIISFGLSIPQMIPPDDFGRIYLTNVISESGVSVTQETDMFNPPRPKLDPIISDSGLSSIIDYNKDYETHVIYHKLKTPH